MRFKGMFLVFLCIGVYLGSISYVARVEGGEGAKVTSFGGSDYYLGTSTHSAPKSLAPGQGSSCSDLSTATYYYTQESAKWCTTTSHNGWLNCTNQDNAGEYWTCIENGNGCAGGSKYYCFYIIYYKKASPPNPVSYDYDGDGIFDSSDGAPGVVGSDPDQKWREKYRYTNKSTGVTYTYYEGDKGEGFWRSSDGSAIPTEYSQSDYRFEMSIYSGEGGYKTAGEMGFSGGGVQGGAGGKVGKTEGGEGISGTSPGKGDGGYSGTASTEGSGSDWTTMYDYLRGIQQNTKATVDNLRELERDLEAIKQNQGLGGTGTGVGSGEGQGEEIDPRPNIDGVKGSVDDGNVVLGEIRDSLGLAEVEVPDPEGTQVTQIQDNSSVGVDENEVRIEAEKGILSSAFDSWWSNNPIKTIVEGSGYSASGGSSFILNAGSLGSKTVDLGGLADGLSSLGVILVGIAGISGIIVVL